MQACRPQACFFVQANVHGEALCWADYLYETQVCTENSIAPCKLRLHHQALPSVRCGVHGVAVLLAEGVQITFLGSC